MWTEVNQLEQCMSTSCLGRLLWMSNYCVCRRLLSRKCSLCDQLENAQRKTKWSIGRLKDKFVPTEKYDDTEESKLCKEVEEEVLSQYEVVEGKRRRGGFQGRGDEPQWNQAERRTVLVQALTRRNISRWKRKGRAMDDKRVKIDGKNASHFETD